MSDERPEGLSEQTPIQRFAAGDRTPAVLDAVLGKIDRSPCLAEEWQRDGRGLWAMRSCRHYCGPHDRHDFTAWKYGVDAPSSGEQSTALARLREADAEREQAIRLLDAHVAALDVSLALCDVHQPERWEGDGTCVLCEGQRLHAEVARLREELDRAYERVNELQDEYGVSARIIQAAQHP